MWISKKEFRDLVDRTARAEAARDWAITQVNILNTELGQWKVNTTGMPHVVPKFKQESLQPPSFPQGEVSFDDVGDDEARKLGYDVD